MFGNLNNSDIENVLEQQFFGHIGCHANDITYVVPVSYAYDGLSVYAHSHEGLKVDMMRRNPSVCFEVDKIENMANWQTVIAWGEFEELQDLGERHKAMHLLLDRKLPIAVSTTVKLTSDWPFYPCDLNEITGVLFRINLTKKTGRFERHGSARESEKHESAAAHTIVG